MTHRTDDEVMGVRHLARRGAGFAENNMHAEVVNGMDVLAVRDAVARAAELCRAGRGPGAASRPAPTATTATRCPTRATSTGPATRRRPGERSTRSSASSSQLLEAGVADAAALAAVEARRRASATPAPPCAPSQATDPDPADVLKYLYTDTAADVVPEPARAVVTYAEPPVAKRDANGAISYKDALREALVEEMLRDRRVIFYGEDVADYGGAFKLTKGLLEAFGRERVFNTPISEAAHLRHGGRRGHGRAPAGRRADVHGLRADGLRPDRQPGRRSGTT